MLFCVLLLSAVLRLRTLDIVEFKLDEALALVLTNQFVGAGQVPLTGMPSSMGPYNPPLMIYLLALPFLCSPEPEATTGFVAAINVVAVALTYWVGRKLFNRSVGLVAAALLACSPWAIAFSRKIWTPNFMPPAILCSIYFFVRWIAHRQPAAVFGLIVSLAVVTQFHFSSGCLLLAIGILWALYRPRVCMRSIGVGLAVAVLLFTPFLIHLWRTSASDLCGLVGLAVRGAPASRVRDNSLMARSRNAAEAAWLVWGNANDLGFEYLSGVPNSTLRIFPPLSYALSWLERLALIAALVMLGRQAFARANEAEIRRRTSAIMLAWLLSPAIFFFLINVELARHYVSICYPAQFIAVGLLADRIARRRPQWRYLVWTLVFAVTATQTLFVLNFQRFVAREGGTPGDYGASLAAKRAIVERLSDLESQAQLTPIGMSVRDWAPYAYLQSIQRRPARREGMPVWRFRIVRSDAVRSSLRRFGQADAVEEFGPVTLLLYRGGPQR